MLTKHLKGNYLFKPKAKTAVFLLFALTSFFAQAINKPTVSFIVPDSENGRFWSVVTDASKVAAVSLGMHLDVVYTDNNRFATLDTIKAMIARDKYPDYVIFRPFEGNAAIAFHLLEKHNIPFVTLENAVLEHQHNANEQAYENWLGHIDFDNVDGSRQLVNALVQAHKRAKPGKALHITAFGGDFDAISKAREQALLQFARENQQVTLNQIFPTYWNADLVEQHFDDILERYPKTNIFWCASDSLALAVLKKMNENSLGQSVIGGFDWMPSALNKIKSGQITASVGGHFLMGANLIVRLFDHSHGIDRFSKKQNSHKFEVITADNVDRYHHFLTEKHWRYVDYQLYSAHYSQTPAEISVEHMLDSPLQKRKDAATLQ